MCRTRQQRKQTGPCWTGVQLTPEVRVGLDPLNLNIRVQHVQEGRELPHEGVLALLGQLPHDHLQDQLYQSSPPGVWGKRTRGISTWKSCWATQGARPAQGFEEFKMTPG